MTNTTIKTDRLDPIFREFLNYKQNIKILSPCTVKSYESDLILIAEFVKAKKNITNLTVEVLKKVTEDELYEYFKTCEAIATRNRRIITLKAFAQWQREKRNVRFNNIILLETAKKKGKKIPNSLSEEECYLLLQRSKETTDPKRDYAIIMLFLNCGLRMSELLALNLNSIKGNKIKVLGKGSKERILSMQQPVVDAVDEYLKVRKPVNDNALFISKQFNRISAKAVGHMVEGCMKLAGIDTSIYHVHSLRHTFATNLSRNGIDIKAIQEMMGHTNISTTAIYLNAGSKMIEDIMTNPKYCICAS